MKLKSMHLEFFKGVTDKTYDFFDRTKVSAENGEGKSTIADAHFWLWCGRNYELVNEPNIRPNNIEECQPRVTETIEHNGREIIVCKYQKCTKKKSDGKVEYAYANRYEINSVGKSKKDFDKYFEDEGIDVGKMLACMHPEVFTRQKDKDMRPVILSMASSKSDLEIAQMNKDTKLLAGLLEKNNKLEEITAMQKATKNKARSRQDEIPSIIEGLEMAKVDVDTAEQELLVADCKRKIADLDVKIANSSKALSDLMGQHMQLEFDLSAITQPITDAHARGKRQIEDELRRVSDDCLTAKNSLADAEKTLAFSKEQLEKSEKQRDELAAKWREEKKSVFAGTLNFNESDWKFDESSTVCSLCGQPLPDAKVEELKATFEQKKADAKAKAEKDLADAKERFNIKKAENITEIEKQGKEAKARIESLKEEIEKCTTNIESLKQNVSSLTEKSNEIEKKLADYPAEVDYTTNADYVALKAKIDEIESEIEKLTHADDPTEEYKVQKAELEKQMDEAKKVIAQASINIANDEKIEVLNREKKEKEQVAAYAQQILDQIDTLSRRKNELLVDEINSHFKIVNWKLFDYQKNGEYKDVCVPMIGDKTFTDSMNTGLRIRAKLDICDSIQKFYGMDLPIFLDNAESINDKNIPATDCQLIVLKVTEDKLKVEEMR